MMDRMTGKSRGFAFVTMNDDAQANAAMSCRSTAMNLTAARLTVNEARPREERPRRQAARDGASPAIAGRSTVQAASKAFAGRAASERSADRPT